MVVDEVSCTLSILSISSVRISANFANGISVLFEIKPSMMIQNMMLDLFQLHTHVT